MKRNMKAGRQLPPPAPTNTNPPYQPPVRKRSRQEAERVRDLLSLNVPLPDVAARLDMSESMLRKLYRGEIEELALRGHSTHQHNQETARQVQACAAVGLSKDQIARIVGLGWRLLVEHYSEDVEVGRAQGELKLAQNIFRRATDKKDQMPQVTSSIFLAKARFGWKETEALEVSGPDGQPIQTQTAVVVLPAKQIIDA
jgi:hypothetical protein